MFRRRVVRGIFPCERRLDSLNGRILNGRLAQLVERLVYTEDVGSSSLSSPTIPASHACRFESRSSSRVVLSTPQMAMHE